MRVQPKRIEIALALLFVVGLVGCASDESIYDLFREYRLALDDDPEAVTEFFSQAYLAQSFGRVVGRDFPEDLNALKKSRLWLQSGEDIEKVHRYTVETSGVSEYQLTIYFSNTQSIALEKIGYTYLRENGQLRIDAVDLYLYPDGFGEIPDEVIDEFFGTRSDPDAGASSSTAN